MTNEDIIKETTLFKVEENYFTANYQGRIYSIGEMLYSCLLFLKEDRSMDYIATKINEDYKVAVDSTFLRCNIDDFIDKVKSTEKRSDTLYNYIYLKVKILGGKAIANVSTLTMPFFNKYVMMVLSPIALFLTVILVKLIFEDGIMKHVTSLKDTFLGIIMMYIGVIIIGLVHEFGHSSSAAYYKQPSSAIGFGFYLIFPVFYSDVTKVWNLNKAKRMVVNLGGIYFQLILNICFFILYINLESLEFKIILKSFVLSNIFLLVYAINPFFRNDGYWMYSDYFGIPNLIREAINFPKEMVATLKSDLVREEKLQFFKTNMPLLIYSLLYHFIMVALIIALVALTYKNVRDTRLFLVDWNYVDWSSVKSYKKILGLLFGLFINTYFAIRITKQFLSKKAI